MSKEITTTDYLNIIKNYIKSENVFKYIFKCSKEDISEWLDNKEAIFNSYVSIIQLSFNYVYIKYLHHRVDFNEDESDVRCINVLEKVYKEYNPSFELMDSIFKDIQIDKARNGRLIPTLKLEESFKDLKDLSYYLYIAKKQKISSNYSDEKNYQETLEELLSLLEMLPFLQHIDFEFESYDAYKITENGKQYLKVNNIKLIYQGNVLSNRNNEVYDSNFVLLELNDNFLFLDKIENHTSVNLLDSYCRLVYVYSGVNKGTIYLDVKYPQGHIDELKGYVCEDDDLYDILIATHMEGYLEIDNPIIKDFYSINFKYIRNLSLAVVDILGENGRNILKENFDEKYGYLFQAGDANGGRQVYDWDVIVAILLLEVGVTNVLKLLFHNNSDYFRKLLENLSLRFGRDVILVNDIVDKAKEKATKMNDTFQRNLLGNPNANGGINNHDARKNIAAEVYARTIVTVISKATYSNEVTETQYLYPIGIRAIINILKEMDATDGEEQRKIDLINRVLNQTLRIIICFYTGFYKYAKCKIDFQDKSVHKFLTNSEIAEYQEKANEGFAEGVNIAYNNISKLSTPLKLLDYLKEMCKEANTISRENNYNYYIREILGRNKLLDFSHLEKLYSILSEEQIDLERYKDEVIAVFKYFRTGIPAGMKKSEGIIFPYAATYEYTNETRDGYNVAHFSIINERNREVDIKVLTEFSYNLNEKYYCVPNILRSNDKLNIWIDPVVISFDLISNVSDEE